MRTAARSGDDDDCEAFRTCENFGDEKLCSNEQAETIIYIFIGMMAVTNGLTLFCCIRVCLQKRYVRRKLAFFCVATLEAIFRFPPAWFLFY